MGPEQAPPVQGLAVVYDERYLINLLRGLASNRNRSVPWAQPLLDLLKDLKRKSLEPATAQADLAKCQHKLERALEDGQQAQRRAEALQGQLAKAQEKLEAAARTARKARIAAAKKREYKRRKAAGFIE